MAAAPQPDNTPRKKFVNFTSLRIEGHHPDDPNNRDDFETRIDQGGKVLAVREDLLSAMRTLGVYSDQFIRYWSYLNSFPTAVALALENGWNTAGVQAATEKLLDVAAQVLSPEDVIELRGPGPQHNTSGVALEPKDHKLPQWPRWGENS